MSTIGMWFFISIGAFVLGLLVFCISYFKILTGKEDSIKTLGPAAIAAVIMGITGNTTWILGAIWLILYFIQESK